MPHSTSICLPVDPFLREHPLLKKTFIDDGYTLELSHVCIPEDVLLILDWLRPRKANTVWRNMSPKKELSQTYQESLQSPYSQSFMIRQLTRRKPLSLCQIDIDRLYGRNVLEQWEAEPGDFLMRLLVSPHISRIQNALFNIIQTFSEYVAQYPEVGRIISLVDEGYYMAGDVLARAGWQSIRKIQLPEYRAILYAVTRKTLMERFSYIV